jgi:hypothetical protein
MNVTLRVAGSAIVIAWLVASPVGAQTMPPQQQPPPAVSGPPPARDSKHFSPDELIEAGHHFFGGVSR